MVPVDGAAMGDADEDGVGQFAADQAVDHELQRLVEGGGRYHTSVYVNFLMDEGQERIRQAYGSAKYDRLQALKQKYDPDNYFRLNQNIPPR
jgi:hypothetical protein